MAGAAAQTIPEVLTRAVERHGEREALVGDGEHRLTYAQLSAEVEHIAAALIASGIEAKDRVAIWAPNSASWVLAALASYQAGAVVVPINTRFKGGEAAHVLRTSGAQLLFTVDGFLGNDYIAMLGEVGPPPDLREIVMMPGSPPSSATAWETFSARADELDPAVVTSRALLLSAADVSDIIFTSGTTGAPKGAMLAHGPAIRAYEEWTGIVRMVPEDRYLIVNPFFHVFGLKAGILACLLRGSTMIPHAVFDVPSVMRRAASERVSVLPGPPTIYQSILDHPDLGDFDMSALRFALTGAATVPVELVKRMRNELDFDLVLTGYGLTETIGIVSVCRPEDDPETIATTAGRPMPGIEVEIVGVDGSVLGVDEPGEVLVRGYNVMSGYFGDAEATAAALTDDGWLRTGDIGIVDARGNLRITDRKNDMFIVGGFNAYPAEIENIILENDAVSQVAVVGVPDERMGEVGEAYVIPRPGRVVEPEALIAWCRERMANYKVPRRVDVVDALPLNATGKVLKYELRAISRDRSAREYRPLTPEDVRRIEDAPSRKGTA
jgi:acyl-CoA synthetase (AMP-forming)/AMP-acid ligase II